MGAGYLDMENVFHHIPNVLRHPRLESQWICD